MSHTRTFEGPVETRSEEETEALGERLAAQLSPDGVLLLIGPMGSGKTQLTRGLARGLGIDPRVVQSPTFTLVHEYKVDEYRCVDPAIGTASTGLELIHVDLYRLEPEEVDGIGLDELLESGSIVVIEWADRLPFSLDYLGRRVLALELSSIGEGARLVERVSLACPDC